MRAIGFRDLEDLGPQRFQELVAALVLADHPDAEQLTGADGGADVLLERDGEKATAWQVKHFPRQIRWEHCRDSLDAVVESYEVAEVVFVFPRDMSKRSKETFDTTLRSRHPGVAVSYMSGSQVIARLRRLEDGPLLEEFFGPDPQDQAVAIARHLGSNGLRLTAGPEADPMTEDLTLAAMAGGHDRYYRTDVSLTTGDTPSPSWAEPPLMLLVGKERDRTLRVAVWPGAPRAAGCSSCPSPTTRPVGTRATRSGAGSPGTGRRKRRTGPRCG
ncbi:MAG TPA: restriction endonuclease [Solirubrobacterales bacterium]|nr:restriction endonuclease [Solirubrobacterales bacterium]